MDSDVQLPASFKYTVYPSCGKFENVPGNWIEFENDAVNDADIGVSPLALIMIFPSELAL